MSSNLISNQTNSSIDHIPSFELSVSVDVGVDVAVGAVGALDVPPQALDVEVHLPVTSFGYVVRICKKNYWVPLVVEHLNWDNLCFGVPLAGCHSRTIINLNPTQLRCTATRVTMYKM